MFRKLKKKFYSSNTVVRQFGKYSDFHKELMQELSDRFGALAEYEFGGNVIDLLDCSGVNIEKFRGKKFVQISTWNTTCGIAAYCKALKEGLDELSILSANDVIPLDIEFIRQASYMENENFYEDVARHCCGYDIICVQYEFGFFASHKYVFPKDIELFCNFAKKLSLQYPHAVILIYIHTSPYVLGFKNAVDFFRISEKFVELSVMNNICFMANTLNLINDWYSCGVRAGLGIDPVKKFYKESLYINSDLKDKIKQELNIKPDDFVLMMLGFINPMKRYDEMAEILSLLPENYKLLAAGGIFPDSPKKYLERFIKKLQILNLEKRVYITGLFNDEDLGTYFDIADIMCAPYAKVRSGSGSIPMLLLSEKPVIAYKTDMIELINSQCDFHPVIEVEYDNREMFKNKILELSNRGGIYLEAVESVKKYSEIMNNKKLAMLVLKTLEEKCLRN